MRYFNLGFTQANLRTLSLKFSNYHLSLCMASVLLMPTSVNAYTIINNPSSATQRAYADIVGPSIIVNPLPAVSGSTLPIKSYEYISVNSQPSGLPGSGFYSGGSGIAYEAHMPGPIIFSDNIPRRFESNAIAAVSANNGFIRTQVSGNNILRVNEGQFDYAFASGASGGQIFNNWDFRLNRLAAEQLSTNPLDFTLTLDVKSNFAQNPINDVPSGSSLSAAKSRLSVNLFVSNLILNPSTVTTTSDGRQVIEKISYSYEIDSNSPTQQTLTINQSLNQLLQFWTGGNSGPPPIDGSFDFKSRSCLDFNSGSFANSCNIFLRTEITLESLSNSEIADVSVNASWDASINGLTDGLIDLRTSAGNWGESIDPLLLIRPSQISAVPESEMWGLYIVGLGMLGVMMPRRLKSVK